MEIHGEQYQIEVKVSCFFHASHSLPTRPEMHSHRWEVELAVCGPLNCTTGMVVDMLTLTDFFRPYTEPLNGINLHEFPDFNHENGMALTAQNPTCDTLAYYFMWKIMPEFKTRPDLEGLYISYIKVSIFEPEGNEPWGHALIRPAS